jgi:hypothetical protein
VTLGNGLYGLPEPEKPKRPLSRKRWWIRVPLIILVIAGISLTTLSVIGGNSDAMKLRLESYLNEITGMESDVGILNGVHFYPVMGVDAQNVTLKSGGTVRVRIGSIRVYVPFWNMPLGRSDFRDFDIANVTIEPGIITPRGIEIDRLMIDNQKSAPLLVLDGRYGGEPVSLRVDLKSRAAGAPGTMLYDLADDAAFTIRAGDISARGIFHRKTGKGLNIDLEEFRAGKGINTIKADLRIFRSVEGTVESGQSSGRFNLDISRKDHLWTIRGEADADRIDTVDIAGDKGLAQSWQAMERFYLGPERYAALASAPYDFSRIDMEIKTGIKSFLRDRTEWGALSGLIAIQNSRMNIDPLEGHLRGGEAKGAIRLDAAHDPARLDIAFEVHKLGYSASPDGDGQADVTIEAASAGNNADALWENLQGKAAVMAGPGDLTGDLAESWTRGLLPDDARSLDCGVAEFVIRGPVATAQKFFLDSGDSTVSGKGIWNLRRGVLEIRRDSAVPEKDFCQGVLNK